jgi:hypothetical protein
MTSTLRALAIALEDDPWCGTRPPHWPHRLDRASFLEDALAQVELNPQPLPPRSSFVATAALQQLRLYQIGHSLHAMPGAPAEISSQLTGLASAAFDETCGSVPLSVLIGWLLHHVPPPPPPWLGEIDQLATQLKVASRMEGSSGAPLQQACLGLLKERLSQLPAVQAR